MTDKTITTDGVTIDDIRRAASVIAGHVVRTPAVSAPRLAEATGASEVVLKLENQQYTGSFKDRGAFNKLASLDAKAKTAGVIAMSAGNHAQGVAYHAQRLGIPSTIVMPVGTPFNKVERTASFGARVLIDGDSIDAAAVFARDMAAREGLTFVHPYDDPLIVAGQGTIGLELLADYPELDTIVVPIGGGGVMSGVAIAAKSINPKIEMIGVEAALYPSMHNAVRGLAPNNGGQTIAEGIAVKSPGKLTQAIITRLVSDLLLVNEDALERAVQMLAERQKVVAEGAGAAGLAAMIAHPGRFKGPQGRAGHLRRQYRFTDAGPGADARIGARGPRRHPAHRNFRHARRAGQAGPARGPQRRQHHRDPSPAHVPRSAGEARRCGRCDRDPQSGALPRDHREPWKAMDFPPAC